MVVEIGGERVYFEKVGWILSALHTVVEKGVYSVREGLILVGLHIVFGKGVYSGKQG